MSKLFNSDNLKQYWFPIALAFISAIFGVAGTLYVQWRSKETNEISYTISDPITYIDQKTVGGLDIRINEAPVTDLIAYNVRIWNSGDVDYENLPIQVEFVDVPQDFQIIRMTHSISPKPVSEFDVVANDTGVANRADFLVPLLNEDSEISFSFLTNAHTDVLLTSTAKGMKLVKIEDRSENVDSNFVLGLIIGLISAVPAFIFWIIIWNRTFTGNLNKILEAQKARLEDYEAESTLIMEARESLIREREAQIAEMDKLREELNNQSSSDFNQSKATGSS